MHIVHVLTRMATGGSEENTVATCRWQVEAGHRVTLIHGGTADRRWAGSLEGIEAVGLPPLVHPVRPASDLRAYGALRRQFRDLRPDVIHTHQSKAGVLGRLAAVAAPGARVVHGLHILPPRNLAMIAAERVAARRTDLFVAVSDAVGTACVAAGVARAGAVHCVRSGMDLGRFRGDGWPEDWRRLLGLPPGATKPPVVLMLAALEPRKRHVALLRAFREVLDEVPEARLVLAGDGPERAAIRAEIDALELGGRVVMTGHRTDPERLLALADVAVLVSEREGLPRVAVQAAASGTPLVVTDMPGIGEVVRTGETGLVVPDPPAAARAVAGLLRDAALRGRLAAGARGMDLSGWALDTLGARTTALYDAA